MSNNPLAKLQRFDPEEDLLDKTPLLNLALEKDPALSRFLVEIQFEGRWRKCEWNPEKELKLNHPLTHVLECANRTIYVRNLITGEKRLYPHLAVLTGSEQVISPVLVLRLRVFLHNKPAYVGSEKRSPDDILFTSSGRLDQILGQTPVGKIFTGQIEDLKLFSVREVALEIEVTPMSAGLVMESTRAPAISLSIGVPVRFAKKSLDELTLRKENYWWRFNLSNPHPMELSEVDGLSPLELEGKAFSRFLKVVSAIGIALGFYVSNLPPQVELKKELPELATTIQLKKPKVIIVKETPKPKVTPPPVVPPKPKPKPKVVAKAPEPKKPEPKKPEPKKPEKKLAAKPIPKKLPPAPPKQVVAKPLPKAPPPPVAHKTPPQVITQAPPPPPRQVAAPPRTPPPPVPAGPTPEQVRAMAQAATKAKLSKSLGFLSTAPSKSVQTLAVAEPNSDLKYQNVKQPTHLASGKNSMLGSMAASGKASSEEIATTASRNIASGTGVSGTYGGKSKGLNEVQGKVSLAGIGNGGGADALGSSLGGGGMVMSGKGSITEAQLQKALSKYLQRFQYCYEKALLSESLLAGNLTLQWTIQMGGKATDAQVVKSQLNSKALHNCVISEISRIPFPSPSGGPVTVKYPFAFSSSTL